MIAQPVIAVFAAAAGACAGSFIATAVVRATRGEQAVAGRSHCDHCGVALGFLSTAPVVSFIGLRGACARCGGRIDIVHFAGELCGAAAGAAACLVSPLPYREALLAALGLVLVALSLHDAKTRRLPDALTGVAAMLCLALSATRSLEALAAGAVAAVAAFAVLEVVRRGFFALRKTQGLGFGDVKLVAALALWLGAFTPWAVAAASLCGLAFFAVARPADRRIPFGPFLALGGALTGLVLEALQWPTL